MNAVIDANAISNRIYAYLEDCGKRGAYISVIMRDLVFVGYAEKMVALAELHTLVNEGYVVKLGTWYCERVAYDTWYCERVAHDEGA